MTLTMIKYLLLYKDWISPHFLARSSERAQDAQVLGIASRKNVVVPAQNVQFPAQVASVDNSRVPLQDNPVLEVEMISNITVDAVSAAQILHHSNLLPGQAGATDLSPSLADATSTPVTSDSSSTAPANQLSSDGATGLGLEMFMAARSDVLQMPGRKPVPSAQM
jgi:hypothetical protein